MISKIIKRLNHITGQMYEAELVKPAIGHRNTENQHSLVVFFFYIRLNRECWSFSTSSSKSLKFCDAEWHEELELSQTPSTRLCRNKVWKTLFSLKSETNGMPCAPLPSQQPIFSLVLAALSLTNTIKGKQVFFRTDLDARERWGFAVNIKLLRSEE